MLKRFEYEFEDKSEKQEIRYDYGEDQENLEVEVENGVPVIYANSAALMVMAKLFLKMSLGSYRAGFHVHIRSDFDAAQSEALRVVLLKDQ